MDFKLSYNRDYENIYYYNKSFKFPAFLGNEVLIKEVDVIILYFTI